MTVNTFKLTHLMAFLNLNSLLCCLLVPFAIYIIHKEWFGTVCFLLLDERFEGKKIGSQFKSTIFWL